MRRIGWLAVVALLGLAGCGPTTGGSSPGSSTLGTGTPPVNATATTPVPAPPVEPSAVVDYKVTYGFAVPSKTVTINHTVNPPIGGASDPPLPWLVGIYAADHPEGNPQYQRISFYFRGAFPAYAFGYVASLVGDGSGAPISLAGNGKLRIAFSHAQAHNNAGASTITAKPSNPIGFHNLVAYAPAGDFEGTVTYGLGLQVAPNSDQVLSIRTGELKKPDGAGGFFYVVHFDVQTA